MAIQRDSFSLLRSLAWRQIAVQYRGGLLGPFWTVLQPLLMFGLYFGVFAGIFQGRFGKVANESAVDYGLGIFLGLSLFTLVAEVIGSGPSAVVTQANLIKRTALPAWPLPGAHLVSSLLPALVSLTVAVAATLLTGSALNWWALLLPLILVPWLMLTAGLVYLLAAIGTFLRDLSQLARFLSQALLYASGVFYSSNSVPEPLWRWLRINPLLHANEALRDILLWGSAPNWSGFLYLWVFSLAFAIGSIAIFRRLENSFADVL